MKRTWIFFKLRMLQLRSDKTALFFSYAFPVLLLLGIGYPMSINEKPGIEVHYTDQVHSVASRALLTQLDDDPLVELVPYDGDASSIARKIEANEVRHYLEIREAGQGGGLALEIRNNTLDDNLVENAAVGAIVKAHVPDGSAILAVNTIRSDQQTSYVVTLLPGLIGMTLLIIGLNGFGNVLIEEEHSGLYKNIKTIDVSPVPFLGGLFLSRLLVCYTVAVALFLIGVFVFNMSARIDYLMLFIVVTLGSLAFLGLGLMIATLSPSVSAFNGIVNFVQLPCVALGGVFFSIAAFPAWVKVIAQALPLTSMNTAIQKVMFDSAGLGNVTEISTELAMLVAWCVVTLAISRRQFRWARGMAAA